MIYFLVMIMFVTVMRQAIQLILREGLKNTNMLFYKHAKHYKEDSSESKNFAIHLSTCSKSSITLGLKGG